MLPPPVEVSPIASDEQPYRCDAGGMRDLWHYTDDGESQAVQSDLFSNDFRVSAEVLSPEHVADDRDASACPFVSERKISSDHRSEPQYPEVIGRHDFRRYRLGICALCDGQI